MVENSSDDKPESVQIENTPTFKSKFHAAFVAFTRLRWRRWLVAIVTAPLLLATAALGYVRTIRPRRSSGEPAPKRQSWFFVVVPSIPVLVAVILGGYAVVKAQKTDIVIRDFIVPQKVKDEGFDPNQALRVALANLPKTLRSIKNLHSESRSRGVHFAELTQIGNESFCSVNPTPLQLTVVSGFFDENKLVDAELESRLETKIFEQAGLPLQSFVEWFKRTLSIPYVVVDFTLSPQDKGYRLISTVSVVRGSIRTAHQERFIRPGQIMEVDRVTAALEETLLRIAYPEIAALALAARGTGSLDIEAFFTEQMPSANRTLALDLARINALLNSPNNAARADNLMQAAKVLNGLMARTMTTNKSEEKPTMAVDMPDLALLSFGIARELALFRRVIGVPDPAGCGNGFCEAIRTLPQSDDRDALLKVLEDPISFYHQAAIGTLKGKAEKDKYDLDTLSTSQEPEMRFRPEARRYVEARMFYDILFSEGFQEINRYKARLDSMIAFATTFNAAECCGTIEKANVVSAIHDSAILFMMYAFDRSLDGKLNDQSRRALSDLLRFHDGELAAIGPRLRLFTKQELAYLESVAAMAQLTSGDTEDAFRRIARAGAVLSTCGLLQVGSVLSSLPGRVGLEGKSTESAITGGIGLLRKAEKAGVRNLSMYNAIGIASSKLGNWEDALQSYDTALSYDGDIEWILLNMGWVYYNKGEYEEAETAFRKSLGNREIYNPIYNAVKGLLFSLLAQRDLKGLTRAYTQYQDDLKAQSLEEAIAVTDFLVWGYCTGELDKLPSLPPLVSERYPLKDGSLDCAAGYDGVP